MLQLSNSPPNRHLTHGVIWRHASVYGVRSGDWAYLTPGDAEGLSQTEFRNSLPEVQIATVRLWFGLNLTPYSLDGGPWFSFGSQNRGFDRSYFAPTRVSASEAIDREFGDLLSPQMGELIASQFPGDWMWNAPPSQLQIGAANSDDALIHTEILRRLEQLETQVESVTANHGRVGHNSRHDDLPVDPDEAQALLRSISATRQAVQESRSVHQIERAWSTVQPVIQKLGVWVISRADIYVTEALKSAGQKTGDILVIAAAASMLSNAQAINLLLQHLFK